MAGAAFTHAEPVDTPPGISPAAQNTDAARQERGEVVRAVVQALYQCADVFVDEHVIAAFHF